MSRAARSGADGELTAVLAQVNPLVGDIAGNTEMIIDATRRSVGEHGAGLVAFPEMAITGYPPEDLLLRPQLHRRVERALATLCRCLERAVHVVVGYPKPSPAGLLNVAGVMHQGAVIAEGAKRLLPNYQVFDERRYFVPGQGVAVVPVRGFNVALSICEDLWEPAPSRDARSAGADLLVNINASPYHMGKAALRAETACRRAAENGLPVLYVNAVGGQDELVFDGGSLVADRNGRLVARAPHCASGLHPVRLARDGDGQVAVEPSELADADDAPSGVYQALALGLRDYADKNGFGSAVLGVSGGIDSALTLAVAADALGPERVTALMMPSRYTAKISVQDAEAEARALGVHYRSLSIEPLFEAARASLAEDLRAGAGDKTEENLQARCRGILLMAVSNRYGALALTTGNKSELSVGYATLYGDMAGGFNVLKDVSKTLVYQLAAHRNGRSAVIPERVLRRAPSAELAPDQKDSDSLPPYASLDPILERYIEAEHSRGAIVEAGFSAAHVDLAIRLVERNEFKRRQSPIGPRITQRGFGRDRRYPVTSGWALDEPDWKSIH